MFISVSIYQTTVFFYFLKNSLLTETLMNPKKITNFHTILKISNGQAQVGRPALIYTTDSTSPVNKLNWFSRSFLELNFL